MSRFSHLALPNQAEPSPDLLTSGQPSPEQLEAAAQAGVRTVVNLRPSDELAWNEQAKVEHLGLRYVAIPFKRPVDVSKEAAEALRRVLVDESAYPVLVHCGSGMRAGALLGAKAFHCDGCDLDTAIATAKAAGLTQFEAELRQCLCEKGA